MRDHGEDVPGARDRLPAAEPEPRSFTTMSAVLAAAPGFRSKRRAASPGEPPTRVFDRASECSRQFPRAVDALEDAEALSRGRDLADVLRVRTDDDRDALRPGLDRVVASRCDQAAADESEEGVAVERRKLADRVEKVDIGIVD